MLKAVIFDMDGVIIDSEPIYFKVANEIFHELGIRVSEEEIHSYVGTTSKNMWSKIKQKHGLDCPVGDLIKMEIDNYIDYLLYKEDIKPIDKVTDFIEDLHKNNIKLALASSAARLSIKIIVKKFKLEDYFKIRISGEEIKNGKPAPDIFLHASDYLDAKPDECVVVEDSTNGVKAAKAAGMKCIGYKNINSGNQDLSSSDMVISNFSEISYIKLCELFKL